MPASKDKDTYSLLERLLFPRIRPNRRRLERALDGKTVLITGASSGIGEQVARSLAGFNVRLILVARREDKLAAIQRSMESQTAGGPSQASGAAMAPGSAAAPAPAHAPASADAPGAARAQIIVYPADLRDEGQLDGLLAFLHRLPDGLDIVVSNAGHSIRRPIGESLERYHDFARTMSINYLAPVKLLLSVIPLLSARGGQIVNVSTVSALLPPVPRWAAYQASKGAMDIWFRSAAPELNAMGISATSVYLPLVRTPMILPTSSYRKLPAMSAAHAADMICRSMYTRSRSCKPWWLVWGELGAALPGRLWERIQARSWRRKGGSA